MVRGIHCVWVISVFSQCLSQGILRLLWGNYVIIIVFWTCDHLFCSRWLLRRFQRKSFDWPNPVNQLLFTLTCVKPPAPQTLCSTCCISHGNLWRRRAWRGSCAYCSSIITRYRNTTFVKHANTCSLILISIIYHSQIKKQDTCTFQFMCVYDVSKFIYYF